MKQNLIFALVNSNALISLFLIPLFLGKLFIVDASVINLLSQGQVSFVKKYCQKDQSGAQLQNTYEFQQDLDARYSITEIGSFCTPQFNFNVFNWSTTTIELITKEDISFTSKLSYLYLDSQSPPPRLM